MAAFGISCVTSALVAQGITPWQVGDVFAGVGSSADSRGIYKSLDATGRVKLDLLGALVPDLRTATDWTTSCFIDPTVSDGDLWATSWADMTLSHFSIVNHALLESFAFNDPRALAVPLPGGGTDFIALPSALAALRRAKGVPALPVDALGDIATLNAPDVLLGETYAQAIDNGDRSAVIAPMPAIQAINAVIFATSGPYAGQFYVGTGAPPDNGIGRGHGYLLRLKYGAGSLTLTGWWSLDAGAIADRSLDRLNDPADAESLVDGSSNGAGGIDNIDLTADQQTIVYTSQDPYIRSVNIVTGQAGAPIALRQQVGAAWQVIADARALGIRALPGKVDGSGTLDATAAGDGSAGYLVAVAGGFVYRVDKDGHVLYRYVVNGHPAALTVAPDAQYFWTATTQDDPFRPQPGGGLLYRFHVSSGVGTGPFSPYGPPFAAGTTAQGHGVYGLCAKHEYFAGAMSADQQKACFAMNADGSPQLDANGQPIADYCRTPTLCSPFVRGVALSPSGVPLGPTDPANADCYPPGAHKPTFAGQHSHEGDAVSLDLRTGNPELVIDGVDGLPLGLHVAGGIVSGTIDTADCSIQNGTCSHPVTVHAHFTADADAQGNIAMRTDGAFTWLVDDGNTAPTLDLAPDSPTVATVLHPLTIALSIFDRDANDFEILKVTNAPPGMTITDHTGSGSGFAASVSGTPELDPPYPHVYTVTIDLFDCTPDWGAANAATSTVASLQAAIAAGNCFHQVSKTFTLTMTNVPPNHPPVCTAANASPKVLWPPNHKLAPFSILGVTDADNDPLTITITRITQDQPPNGTGDDSTPFDATGVGTSVGAVRAERTGDLRAPDDGRLYQIDFTASDGKPAGTCTGAVFIGVPHDQGQHSLPSDHQCRWDSTTGAQLGACAWLKTPALTPKKGS